MEKPRSAATIVPTATRREFLLQVGLAAGLLTSGCSQPRRSSPDSPAKEAKPRSQPPGRPAREGITVFLCGDVMTGRGIDQILPHPGEPRLDEPFIKDARDYVTLAERVNGPIPRAADPAYVWGDALAELDRVQPDLRIVNLETAVTDHGEPWPEKDIHYRMHSALAAKPSFCVALLPTLPEVAVPREEGLLLKVDP